jgi:hypothetical protein
VVFAAARGHRDRGRCRADQRSDAPRLHAALRSLCRAALTD